MELVFAMNCITSTVINMHVPMFSTIWRHSYGDDHSSMYASLLHLDNEIL
jgi:hypothetical protein